MFMLQVALNQAVDNSTLANEAAQTLLEEDERQKEELKQALCLSENRGKQFHEVLCT